MNRSPTEHYEVYVLEYARSKNQPVASLLLGVYDEGVIDLPFAFVLARNARRTVLVDTGFMRQEGGARMAEKFAVTDWISPLTLLSALGVAPEQVTDIVLTHAHYDHMGAIDQFPAARLHLQERELLSWVSALAMPKRFSFLTAAVNPEDLHAALHSAEAHQLNLLQGDTDDVVPGIHGRLAADSHTFGSQFVVVETARGRHVISGDCMYSYRNITGRNGDGVYIPLGFGVGSHFESLKAIDRIHAEVEGDLDRIVVLHDDERWARFTILHEIEGFKIVQVA